MVYYTNSPKETEQLARAMAKRLVAGDVIAFFGGLGAGKTAFVRGLCSVLAPDAFAKSPTFALINEYAGPVPLYHFDMYRITDEDDLYSTGFYDYLDQNGILAVEWSENIAYALPENHIKVTLTPLGEEKREIRIEGGDRFEDLKF